MSLPGNLTHEIPYTTTNTNTNANTNTNSTTTKMIQAALIKRYMPTPLTCRYMPSFLVTISISFATLLMIINWTLKSVSLSPLLLVVVLLSSSSSLSSSSLLLLSSLLSSLSSVGQTCFICGSHILERSAEIMVDGKVNDLTSRMIRYYHHHENHPCHYHYYCYHQTSSQSW